MTLAEQWQQQAAWQRYLDSGALLSPAQGPQRDALLRHLAMQAKTQATPAPLPRELGRWQRWRGLLDPGWDARNRTPISTRLAGMMASIAVNAFFLLFLLASMYLRWSSPAPLAEAEEVRIRITGFGTPATAGGGAEAADAPAPATAISENPPAAARRPLEPQAAAGESSRSRPAPDLPQLPLPTPPEAQLQAQPLQLTTPPLPASSPFQLPPTRQLEARPLAAADLTVREMPAEAEIPAPLAEARRMALPAPREATLAVAKMPEEAAIPAPLQMPQQARRALAAPVAAAQPRTLALSERALPELPAAAPPAGNEDAMARTQAPAATASGLPQARGVAASAGQRATTQGTGPAREVAADGWQSARRGDDWDAARANRAGNAAGGSGLVTADGRARLADDRFAARFPDPYKEGSWLRRPQLDTRGSMFDGIWRPPETLLEEWVRRGIKSVRIPIPGTTMELECVISVLQVSGGCLPRPGKDGKFDQPARARQPPATPFKPELFADPEALTRPTPAGEAD